MGMATKAELFAHSPKSPLAGVFWHVHIRHILVLCFRWGGGRVTEQIPPLLNLNRRSSMFYCQNHSLKKENFSVSFWGFAPKPHQAVAEKAAIDLHIITVSIILQ